MPLFNNPFATQPGEEPDFGSRLFSREMSPMWASVGSALLQAGAAQPPGQDRWGALGRGAANIGPMLAHIQERESIDKLRNLQAMKVNADMQRQANWAKLFSPGGQFDPTGSAPRKSAPVLGPPTGNKGTLFAGEPTPEVGTADSSQMVAGDGMAAPVPTMFSGQTQPPARPSLFERIPPEVLPMLAAMGPEHGASAIVGAALRTPHERQTREDSKGVVRFVDTGEPVFKDDKGKPQAAPTTRTRISDGETIQEEYGPNGWQEVGRGPRWSPKEGKGELSTAQERINAEISGAREELDAMGLSMDEIMRRTQPTTSTGRENPDFNPYLKGLVTRAQKKMYGEDKDFKKYSNFVYGTDKPVSPPPAETPPPATSSGPSFFGRVKGSLFGNDTPAPAQPTITSPSPAEVLGTMVNSPPGSLAPKARMDKPPAPTRQPSPVGDDTRGATAIPLPMGAGGKIDPTRLQPNASYKLPDGRVLVWDGRQFNER